VLFFNLSFSSLPLNFVNLRHRQNGLVRVSGFEIVGEKTNYALSELIWRQLTDSRSLGQWPTTVVHGMSMLGVIYFTCIVQTYTGNSSEHLSATSLGQQWRHVTFCGERCQRHVAGQRVVSDISAVSILACVLNLIIPFCYCACPLLYLERLFCFTHQTKLALEHGGVYLVTIDTDIKEISDDGHCTMQSTSAVWSTQHSCVILLPCDCM